MALPKPSHFALPACAVRFVVEERSGNAWCAHSIHDQREDAVIELGVLVRSRGCNGVRMHPIYPLSKFDISQH